MQNCTITKKILAIAAGYKHDFDLGMTIYIVILNGA